MTGRSASTAPGRSPAGRSRCRCSPCTPLGPAGDRSPGATRVERSGSAPGPRAPTRARRPTAAAGPSRRSPTRTCCSGTWEPTRRWPGASSSTWAPPRRRSGRSPGSSSSSPVACAEGIVRVANAEMVRALRVVTVERGIDPRRLCAARVRRGRSAARGGDRRRARDRLDLVSARVGGAGGARPGRLAAPPRRTAHGAAVRSGADRRGDREHRRRARRAGAAGARSEPRPSCAVTYELRYRGQSFELPVQGGADPTPDELRKRLRGRARDRYGYSDPEQALELVTVRVSATSAGAEVALAAADEQPAPQRGRRSGHDPGGAARVERGRAARRSPAPGSSGPAVVELAESTLLVPPGWRGRWVTTGTIGMRRDAMIDPVELQVLTGALRAVCEEMGAVLIRSAHSAEHQGAPRRIHRVVRRPRADGDAGRAHPGAPRGDARGGRGGARLRARARALLDPQRPVPRAGTHLPDITVIEPVFAGGAAPAEPVRLIAFAANRAHHADVGGPTPGSMPADSRTLADEGVVIEPRVLDESAIGELVGLMRQPDQRRADLRAQLRGDPRRRAPPARATRASRSRDARARRSSRCSTTPSAAPGPASPRCRTVRARAADVLEAIEGDLEIVARGDASTGDRLTLDFTGSAPQHGGNLNCPLAVTRSACYFAVRVLTDPDIPPAPGPTARSK